MHTKGMIYMLGSVPVASALAEIGLCGGKVYFVDPTNGLAGGDGLTPSTAQSSLETAYGWLRDGKHDTIVMIPGATANTLTAAITWSKSYCHLIGAFSPIASGQRCRVQGSASSDLAVLITVSGTGNSFHNIKFYNGKDSDATQTALTITGARNYFKNCEIVGVAHATPGARTDAYDIKLTGAEENTFEDCQIGADTFDRTAASAHVICASGAVRNIFRGCRFVIHANTATTPLFLTIPAAGGIDRYLWFQNCYFANDGPASAGGSMAEAFNIHDAAGGYVICDNCSLLGATDWEAATVSSLTMLNNATGAVNGGLVVAQTA